MPADAFTALAEPNRRRILDLLVERERPVAELVGALTERADAGAGVRSGRDGDAHRAPA